MISEDHARTTELELADQPVLRHPSIGTNTSETTTLRTPSPLPHPPVKAWDNDEEAKIGWDDKDVDHDFEMDELLSSGGTSPVLKSDEDDLIKDGATSTTWRKELMVMFKTAPPLCATFLLQYSLTMTSIFAVGRLGKEPLAAATLASTTANITGFAIYQGLCTGLDTLCAQAYGSGRLHLVGLQMQRMILFLMLITVPMAVMWLNASHILGLIVPDQEVALLAGQYLRIVVLGAPAYAIFESGKRFLQAQGIFSASTYCLLFTAPLNIFLHWLFIFYFDFGYLGAPIAVVISNWSLPLGLYTYVRLVDGMQCWGGFSRAAFSGWWPMISLSVPGVINVLAEWSAFEIMTLSASWISTTHLAAQAIVLAFVSAFFSVPFAVSIAMSTRVANFVGAGLPDSAQIALMVSLSAGFFFPAIDAIILVLLRKTLPTLMTQEADVISLAIAIMPAVAFIHILDSCSSNTSGILRGIGRQDVSGYTVVFSFYIVGLPISWLTAFHLHWDLIGLWFGIGIGLVLVTGIQSWFIFHADWTRAVKDAKKRNAVI